MEKYGQEINGIILSFLHLGYANRLFGPFVRISSGDFAHVPFIKYTISPKDPIFPLWWEEHKSEWEEPKKGGQEPADDLIK